MEDTIFSFKIGKLEFGMYRHFKCWWFNNGYIREFMWWYVFNTINEEYRMITLWNISARMLYLNTYETSLLLWIFI